MMLRRSTRRQTMKVLNDSGSDAAFRLRLGTAVTGPRGASDTSYASGAIVQYVIERPDGSAYMARESELRVP